MFAQSGRVVGVTIPEGQGQDRITEPNKVLSVGRPLELRPMQFSDEYGRVHTTVVYVNSEPATGKSPAFKRVYFYPPTEEAVKGWRQATKVIQEQVDSLLAMESIQIPQNDTVDVVAQGIANETP